MKDKLFKTFYFVLTFVFGVGLTIVDLLKNSFPSIPFFQELSNYYLIIVLIFGFSVSCITIFVFKKQSSSEEELKNKNKELQQELKKDIEKLKIINQKLETQWKNVILKSKNQEK